MKIANKLDFKQGVPLGDNKYNVSFFQFKLNLCFDFIAHFKNEIPIFDHCV